MLRLLLVTVIVRRGREGRRESNGDKELKQKQKNRTKQDKRGDWCSTPAKPFILL